MSLARRVVKLEQAAQDARRRRLRRVVMALAPDYGLTPAEAEEAADIAFAWTGACAGLDEREILGRTAQVLGETVSRSRPNAIGSLRC